MTWLPHGTSPTGLLFDDDRGQSAAAPAVATYRGRLWCLWTDLRGQLWYAKTGGSGPAERFGEPQPFPEDGLPVLTNLNGVLHVVVVQPDSGAMAHYVHDDDDADTTWTALGPLDVGAGLEAHSTPALVAFHNKLFLAFLRDGALYYAIWAALGPDAQQWTAPAPVCTSADDEDEDETRFRGIPALFVIGGTLHLLCGADTAARPILGFRYDYIGQTWTRSADVSEGRAASGVSAVSFGSSAYLGLTEAATADADADESHAVFVAAYDGGVWAPHEAVAGAAAADPPQIAVLYGRVHCLFNDNTAARALRWYSRPALRRTLSGWMAGLPDDVPLARLTIPGTHDSCARSRIPFVRTQYLSVSQQLALGIRFLDLRLRRHADGLLYCYHGGVPLDYPRGLSLASVMDEVWAFLQPAGDGDGDGAPTECVLVSINNDDTSAEQQDDPAPFYGAVAEAIATTPPWPGSGRHRWHTEPVTPTLGDVRGRAVLLRRFAGDPAVAPAGRIGLDLSAWRDDDADFSIVTPTQVRVRLQDKWKYADRIALHDLVRSKAALVQQMMGLAAAGDDSNDDWFINFCSAVGDPAEHGEIAEAKWIAVGAHSRFIGQWVPGMNVQTRAYLAEAFGGRRARLGIVNLDYPELPEDNDLVARLIETNFG